jgi:putative chitinase
MNWLSILRAIAPKGNASILQGVANAMPGIVSEFELSTPLRQAHFLSQLAHESDGFKTTVEYASGKAYEGRRDLGNTSPGDGVKYKGRGLIQLTGKSNYRQASAALGVDFMNNPGLAAQFPHAIRVAGWYWKTRKINLLADRDDDIAVTRKINGGENGLADRRRYLALAKDALADPIDLPEANPKTMTTSTEGAAAGTVGTAGGGLVFDGVIAAANEAKRAGEAASGAAEASAPIIDIIARLPPSAWIGLIIIAAAGFIWWRRRQRLLEHGV